MRHPTDRIAHTTAFVTPVEMRLNANGTVRSFGGRKLIAKFRGGGWGRAPADPPPDPPLSDALQSRVYLLTMLPRNIRHAEGAGRSSEVERSLVVRWVVGSILHGVDPLSYFSFQPVLHDWCDKGRGMCYPVCGMVHIK